MLWLIERDINFVSLRDSIAAFCATSFTLNGDLILFRASIIFRDPYPQPILKDAKPWIFENVLRINTFFLFLKIYNPDL